MATIQQLRSLGQSLWLDQISRDLLDSGRLAQFIRDHGITGLTSNPTIFEGAISTGSAYDADIARLAGLGKSGDAIFLDLEMADLRRAADLFRPVYEATQGVDGWYRSSSRRCWRPTPRGPSPPPNASTRRQSARTSSSRFRARPRACRRSRNPSIAAFPST